MRGRWQKRRTPSASSLRAMLVPRVWLDPRRTVVEEVWLAAIDSLRVCCDRREGAVMEGSTVKDAADEATAASAAMVLELL